MESTTPSTSPTTQAITVASLAAAFATVPDPRRKASVIYPVPALAHRPYCQTGGPCILEYLFCDQRKGRRAERRFRPHAFFASELLFRQDSRSEWRR